jgi:hypothetical protein
VSPTAHPRPDKQAGAGALPFGEPHGSPAVTEQSMKPSRPWSPQEEELLVEQNLCFLRDAYDEMEKDAAALTRMGSYGHWALRTVFANGERVRMVSKPHRGAALIFGQLLDAVAVGFPLKLFPGPRRPSRWPTADARPSLGPQDARRPRRRRQGRPLGLPCGQSAIPRAAAGTPWPGRRGPPRPCPTPAPAPPAAPSAPGTGAGRHSSASALAPWPCAFTGRG